MFFLLKNSLQEDTGSAGVSSPSGEDALRSRSFVESCRSLNLLSFSSFSSCFSCRKDSKRMVWLSILYVRDWMTSLLTLLFTKLLDEEIDPDMQLL